MKTKILAPCLFALLLLAGCNTPSPGQGREEPTKIAQMTVLGTGGDISGCAGVEGLCWTRLTVRVRVTNVGTEPFGVSAGHFTGKTASGIHKTTWKELGREDCPTTEVIYPQQGRTCMLEFRFSPMISEADLFPMMLGFPVVGVDSEPVYVRR